jgi:hypothetical protein
MLSTTQPVRTNPGRGGTGLKALHNTRRDMRGTYTIRCDHKIHESHTCPASLPLPGAATQVAARAQAATSGWTSITVRQRTHDLCPTHRAGDCNV